ncbi:hypothetical protein ACJX0J_016874, partial [Zea mays]
FAFHDFSGALRQIAENSRLHMSKAAVGNLADISTISTIHSTGMVLILAAVAVLGEEGATLWDSNHRARAQFWRTVAPDMHYKSSSTAVPQKVSMQRKAKINMILESEIS